MAEHATQAVTGRGTLVQRGGALVTDAYETLSEVVGWKIPNVTPDEHEVSHSESPNGFKEFIDGMKDAGEASVDINWRPDIRTTHAALKTDKAAGSAGARWYRFVLPGGMETIPFYGWVKNIERKGGPNAAMQATVTWRVNNVVE